MHISLIAAVAKNRVIGKNNMLPWNIPEDTKHFVVLTKGHPVIMGRRTYDSLKKPLKDRLNIVISRNADKEYVSQYNVIFCSTIEQALQVAKRTESDEIFIIGGAQIYELAMPYADRFYLTFINKDFEGDAYFPDYSNFKKVVKEDKKELQGIEVIFYTLEKDPEKII